MIDLKNLAETAAAACKKAGADEADAYLTRGRKMSIDIFRGEPEVFERAETGGAGLRAFRGKRMGFAYTTDLSESGLFEAACLAYENAASSDIDEFNGLPAGAGSEAPGLAEDFVDLGLTSAAFITVTTGEKIRFALAMEEAALKYDKRVTGCESVTYAEDDATIALANTAGFSGQYRHQAAYGFIDALAEENGEVQTGFSYEAGHSLTELDPEAAGREAADRAVSMLGGQSMKPATVTAVFDPLVFVQVLTAITPALGAEAAQKHRSFLAGSTGRQIAATEFSLIDDGRLYGGLGTSPFDDEGVSTMTTAVIGDGVLNTFLYNSYAGRKTGFASTGNASRGSFRMPPGTAPTNLFVKPGPQSRETIISSVSKGIYVMGLQGLHAGVNAVTGQFSAGAYGLRIEAGQLSGPVREITIASSCADILKNMSAVGSDLRFVPMGAAFGAPTVAVDGIQVGGR